MKKRNTKKVEHKKSSAWKKYNTKRVQHWKYGKSDSIVAYDQSETVVRRCSVKEVFLEILQNSQENTSARD